MQANPFYKAIGLIVLSELFLVFSGMIVKQVTGQLPTEVIVFARNLFALFLLLPWCFRVGVGQLKTNYFRFHLLRAGAGVSAMMCLYYAWGHLPLATAALIKQTAPFFIPLFAFLWLGENVSQRVKVAILVGFVGVAFVLNPVGGTLQIAMLIALVGAMLSAFVKVVIRRMSHTESPQLVVFYFALISSLLAFIPALLSWKTPTLIETGWLLLMAITSTIAQLLLSRGYGLAPAGQLAPFTYASVIFAAFFGWWLWQETLSWNTWLGVGLIFCAALLSLKAGKFSLLKKIKKCL